MLLLQVTQAVADSLQVAADNLDQAIANADGLDKLSLITQQLLDAGVHAGASILTVSYTHLTLPTNSLV